MQLTSFTKNPIDLINWNRFDILFKYLYGKARDCGWNTTYYHDMYKHHLKIWNGFFERENPRKNTFEIFQSDFDSLLDAINTVGFDPSKSLVPVKNGQYVLNGAHRVAACLVYDKDVHCIAGEDIRDGQLDCSWRFFNSLEKLGELDEGYADKAALEYSKLKPQTRIVTLYPSAVKLGKLAQVGEILEKYSSLIYEKKIQLGKTGAVNFMRELYFREEWAEKNQGSGYKSKAEFCYLPKNIFQQIAPTHIYLVEFDDLKCFSQVKEEIRAIYGIGKHSVHINDTHEETVRLAKCVFNHNSIHFLNSFNGRFYPIFEKLLAEFSDGIEENRLNNENYCISAGAVLSAYGLKECKDIDYLHSSPEIISGNSLITSHNEYGIGRYHTERDDIIHNPKNHFYRYGIKYSSLDVVKKLKKKRGEPKDRKDIRLINRLL